ncbi:MAG TPA: [Fe-S]-binding protein, partial [Trueperaceae bacterium]|nr:[Fe-S]-binding protein [Trueperaceae bacterium]
MLSIPEKLLFVLLAATSAYLAYLGFRRVVQVIARGQTGQVPRLNQLPRRVFDGIMRTLGQTTVFRARPVASFFHSFIFYGFILYLLVNVVDAINGLLPPSFTARFGFGVVGDLYRLVADVLTLLILVGMVYFLVRRFLAKPKTMEYGARVKLHEDVRAGGVKRDSLIVGSFILLHVGSRLLAESFLLASHGHSDPYQPMAS